MKKLFIFSFMAIASLLSISSYTMEASQNQKNLDAQLFSAVYKNNSQEIKRLLRAGANIEARNGAGYTPLMSATSDRQCQDALQTLLDEKANVNAVNTLILNETPLLRAVEGDNIQAAQKLIEAGALLEGVNASGETPLQSAIDMHYEGNVNMLNLLIKAKANVHVLKKNGNTLLHLAAKRNIANAIPLLINGGLDIRAKNEKGQTPLHVVVVSRGKYSKETIKKLIESGADIYAVDDDGNIPLQSAIMKNKQLRLGEKNPDALKAFITTITITPQDIQSIIASKIVLTSPIRKAEELPFPRPIGKMIFNHIIQDIVNEKLALARKYLPGMFSEDVLRKEIIQNIKEAINKSPSILAPRNLDTKETSF